MPVLAELISRGDGSFILRPKVPERDLDTWITIRQAAEVIGNLKARSLYPLLGEYLVFRRPLPTRIAVSLKSALALRRATCDPDFWENQEMKERLKGWVKERMKRFVEEAQCLQND
jgi:hypothetical protein